MTHELRGLKAKELTPCRICSGKIGPAFFRVRLEHCAVHTRNVDRQRGLEMMLGSAALADVMGPDEDLAKVITDTTALVCQDCAMNHTLFGLLEVHKEHA